MKPRSVATSIVAGCTAVVLLALPSFAGQMPQGLPDAATGTAKPMSDKAAAPESISTDQAKTMTEMQARMMEQMQAGKDSMAAHIEPRPGAQKPPPHDMSPMGMNPYFSAVNYPVSRDAMMVMALSDYQSARSTNDFFTAMGMVEYGLTSNWTVGFMVEGQKILGSPSTYGGWRASTYLRVIPQDRLLNFTLYGEYEGLNGAALYKMEVAGFGGEDLDEPLASARSTPVRTFEQRAIVYHDWGRVNLTFNFVSETGLDSGENDFGYAWGLFRQPVYGAMQTDQGMAGMEGMPKQDGPSAFSFQRLGYGLEMMGALGNTHQFGFDWHRQQHYLGPVFSYTVSKHWTLRVAPTCGLSGVSDPFMLRMAIGYSFDHLLHRQSPTS